MAPLSLSSDRADVSIHEAYERRISELTTELAETRSLAERRSTPPSPATPAEAFSREQERLKKLIESVEDRDTKRLLAAGFTMERIDWLRRRAQELEAARNRKASELRLAGLPNPDPDASIAYVFDSDLDLRYEIGDDEYEKYRVALGRSAGVPVVTLTPGSIAESVGLKVGDEIVAYNGKRVFNLGELNAIARKKSNPGESSTMALEVRRDGQLIRVNAPRGDMGLRFTIGSANLPQVLRQGVRGPDAHGNPQ
jgi:C-terminal processing protease CtpA/Prc